MKKNLLKYIVAGSILFTTAFPVAADAATIENAITVPRIQATTIDDNSIKLSWDKMDCVDGYQIYKYNPEKEEYILLKTIYGQDAGEYTDSDLDPETKYGYKIRAFKQIGTQTYYVEDVDTASATTAEDPMKEINKIIWTAKTKIGCPYVWAAEGPSCFDCSGFVYWVFNHCGAELKDNVYIPRTSCDGLYSTLNNYIVSYNLNDAQTGDIILFRNGGHYSHTAIALGNGLMIHASSSKGICIADINCITCSGGAVIRVVK